MFRIREFSFCSLIQNRERPYLPGSLGSSQDISALVDVMSATMTFVGFPGNATEGKVQNIILKCVINSEK